MYAVQVPGVIKVIRDGKVVGPLGKGELLPEAVSLPTFGALVRMGWIAEIGDAKPPQEAVEQTVETKPTEPEVVEQAVKPQPTPVPRHEKSRR